MIGIFFTQNTFFLSFTLIIMQTPYFHDFSASIRFSFHPPTGYYWWYFGGIFPNPAWQTHFIYCTIVLTIQPSPGSSPRRVCLIHPKLELFLIVIFPGTIPPPPRTLTTGSPHCLASRGSNRNERKFYSKIPLPIGVCQLSANNVSFKTSASLWNISEFH